MKPSSITASAASSRSPSGSSRSSRRATTSRSRGGTVTSPEASTDAASSSAKNGLPAAERSIAARAPDGSGRPAARSRDRRERRRGRADRARLRRRRRARAGSSARARPPRGAPHRACRRPRAGARRRRCARGSARAPPSPRRPRAGRRSTSTTPRSAAACASSWRDRREDTVAIHGLLPPPAGRAHRRQQPRQRRLRAVGERAGQLRAPRGERIERLHERRVGRAALLLVGGAAQRVKAELLRLGEHSLDEARLAHPQRAHDEQRAAVARRGALQRAERRGELALTPLHRRVEEASRANRRAARELAVERQRLARRAPRRAARARRAAGGTGARRPACRRWPRGGA